MLSVLAYVKHVTNKFLAEKRESEMNLLCQYIN